MASQLFEIAKTKVKIALRATGRESLKKRTMPVFGRGAGQGAWCS